MRCTDFIILSNASLHRMLLVSTNHITQLDFVFIKLDFFANNITNKQTHFNLMKRGDAINLFTKKINIWFRFQNRIWDKSSKCLSQFIDLEKKEKLFSDLLLLYSVSFWLISLPIYTHIYSSYYFNLSLLQML